MGYTTEFRGSFKITPPLPASQVERINAFGQTRHEDKDDVGIGIWCDWVVSQDGSSLSWNGSEKSYDMDRWAAYIKSKFLSGHTLTGTVYAEGEDPDDRWKMVAQDGTILVVHAKKLGLNW